MLHMGTESLADWQQLASIFQGFATGLAVLVGACWAVFRFWSLREVAQAKIRLEKEYRELEERQPVIDLTMRAEQVVIKNCDSLFVNAKVIAKNNGTKIARLAYEGNPPLSIFSVEFPDDGEPVFEERRREHVRLASNPACYAKTTIVRPGQIQEIPFLVNIPSPGWYFLAFRAVQSAADREQLRAVGVPEDRIVSWTAKEYLQVCDHGSADDAEDKNANRNSGRLV